MDLHRYKAKISMGSGYQEKYEPLGTLIVMAAIFLAIGLTKTMYAKDGLGLTGLATSFAYILYWQAPRFPFLITVGFVIALFGAIISAVKYFQQSCPSIEGMFNIPRDIQACYDTSAFYAIWFIYCSAFILMCGYYLRSNKKANE